MSVDPLTSSAFCSRISPAMVTEITNSGSGIPSALRSIAESISSPAWSASPVTSPKRSSAGRRKVAIPSTSVIGKPSSSSRTAPKSKKDAVKLYPHQESSSKNSISASGGRSERGPSSLSLESRISSQEAL